MAMTGYDEAARADMAAARAGLAELQIGSIAVYLALLDAVAESLAGNPAAAERAALDAEVIAAETGERGLLSSFVAVELAHAIARARPARRRRGRACEGRRVRRAVRCRVGGQAAHRPRPAGRAVGRAGARSRRCRGGGGAAEETSLVLLAANAQRALAEVLAAGGRTDAAVTAAQRALALDEAKGNVVAAASTRERFAALLSGAS